MSILVMTTMTGTLRARAIPRCSLSRVSMVDRGVYAEGGSLRHANQTVVCCYHEQTVVWLATE